METLVLAENDVKTVANIIRNGGIVAIPTETVYGLAANTFDCEAIKKIFIAKGRPMDNPLIVHIADVSDIYKLVSDFPREAEVLAEKFWPGPLTMILPKSEAILDEVSAGLETVAIRLPNNRVARDIIRESGVPLAAPSANSSGYPSPTTSNHVINDLYGKIDAVVESSDCEVGLESTVITFSTNPPRILRPGAITLEQIQNVIGDVDIDDAVYNKCKDDKKVLSPGMKYKHYSPTAKVILVKGSAEGYINYLNHIVSSDDNNKNRVFAMCFDEDVEYLNVPCISYGKSTNSEEQAKKLFSTLRKLDELNTEVVYVRSPNEDGVGLAVYNRLIRAAGFEVIKVEE